MVPVLAAQLLVLFQTGRPLRDRHLFGRFLVATIPGPGYDSA